MKSAKIYHFPKVEKQVKVRTPGTVIAFPERKTVAAIVRTAPNYFPLKGAA